MADLELNDNNTLGRAFKSRAILGMPETPGMINFLIRKGIVKSQTQAYYILIGIMIFCFGLAIAVPFIFGDAQIPSLTPEQQQSLLDAEKSGTPPQGALQQ